MYRKIELGFLHGVRYKKTNSTGPFFSRTGSSSFFFLAASSVDDRATDGVVDRSKE